MKITDIHSLILKDGLRKLKFKNSKQPVVPFEEQKGAIFGYRSKQCMVIGEGIVMTSFEAVEDNQSQMTHWTPNVYRYGTYTSTNPRITKGHYEKNLRQINTFYVDIDIKKNENFNFTDILISSIDLGFMPTLILKTDNGYQIYFVLKEAAYVTASTDFKVIEVAKLISQNIRKYFQKEFPVDLTCNHFGISRMPREENIEYFSKDNVYSFSDWLQWSMQQEEQVYTKKPNLLLLTGTEGKKQIDEPWYNLLKTSPKIKGDKALLGRNNVMFTLSLACYSSGVSQISCEEEMLLFNDTLSAPLKPSEVSKIVYSAYSEKYEAASRDYVKLLCQTWISEDLTTKDLFVRQGWYKFKKKRQDRQRSHFSEWESDLLNYIENQAEQETPYFKVTKKSIIAALDIPSRSLDKVFKRLQQQKKIFYRFKSGRGGGIVIASVKQILLNVVSMTKIKAEAFYAALSAFLEFPKSEIVNTIISALKTKTEGYLGELRELDTG